VLIVSIIEALHRRSTVCHPCRIPYRITPLSDTLTEVDALTEVERDENLSLQGVPAGWSLPVTPVV